MGFLTKLKWMFKIQKPAGQVIVAVSEVRKTKKWVHFAVTVLGSLATTAGTLTGVIPPQIQMMAVSVLNALYNIVRGADKADDPTVKGPLCTTEFWVTALVESQKAFVTMHNGGVVAPWLEYTMSALNALSLIFGQNLAARTPEQITNMAGNKANSTTST